MTSFSASTGFFGKLPAVGDFVRAGLPETLVSALDGWCRECLLQARAVLGEAWLDAWMQAPIWRFLLPAPASGQAIAGIWLPSMDKAGRHYPFMLCAFGAGHEIAGCSAWLDLAEAEGLAGVVRDKPHSAIAAALAAETPAVSGALPGWWTEGSPLVRPARFEVAGLPPPATHAAAMLRDAVPA